MTRNFMPIRKSDGHCQSSFKVIGDALDSNLTTGPHAGPLCRLCGVMSHWLYWLCSFVSR